MVAKAGYDALMSGKSKAVPGGLKNKSYEVLSYVAPQETLAAVMRDKMSLKPEEDSAKEPVVSLAWGIGIGIAVIAGIALTIGYKNTSDFQKARYRYKARSAGNSLSDTLSSVVDKVVETVVDAYQNTKEKAGKLAAQEEEVTA